MNILVTGSTGLVGSAVVPFLTTGGHRVVRLVRGTARGPDEVEWNPQAGTIDAAKLEGLDAVVHLAGENIATGRWSAAKKAWVQEAADFDVWIGPDSRASLHAVFTVAQ